MSGNAFSEMGRASSDGEGEVSALDGGDVSALDPGASDDEMPPFCTTEEPLDEEEMWESLETLRRRKVDADRRRMSFKNFMTTDCGTREWRTNCPGMDSGRW